MNWIHKLLIQIPPNYVWNYSMIMYNINISILSRVLNTVLNNNFRHHKIHQVCMSRSEVNKYAWKYTNISKNYKSCKLQKSNKTNKE